MLFFLFWSRKCSKIMKNVHINFPESKMTFENIFVQPMIQNPNIFILLSKKTLRRKQKIITFRKL